MPQTAVRSVTPDDCMGGCQNRRRGGGDNLVVSLDQNDCPPSAGERGGDVWKASTVDVANLFGAVPLFPESDRDGVKSAAWRGELKDVFGSAQRAWATRWGRRRGDQT